MVWLALSFLIVVSGFKLPRADGRILDAGITAVVEQELETGRLKGKVSLNEMIDYSFINLLGKK